MLIVETVEYGEEKLNELIWHFVGTSNFTLKIYYGLEHYLLQKGRPLY
jgi:hypothetical protein